MKLAWWMAAGSVISSLIIAALLDGGIELEVWLGMLGPLAAALASWIIMERQRKRHPERLTAVMIKAFAAKMIFFGLYITVLLKAGWVRPIPFVISFIGYFIALHLAEAIGLRRVQAADLQAANSGALHSPLRNGYEK
jgi:hypothetical protein